MPSAPSTSGSARPATPIILPPDYQFTAGKAAQLREGGDVTIIACGIMTATALEAAETLAAEGIEARVLNMATIHPIDEEAVAAAAAETGAIVTAEEHQLRGGLGSAAAAAAGALDAGADGIRGAERVR